MVKHQINYRHEKKFIIEKKFQFSLIKNLLENNFIVKYPDRKINNIYFEDFYFNAYKDNYEGFSKREKIRIRWYGDTYAESMKNLEFKVKKEDTNFKEIFSLGKCKFYSNIERNNFDNLFRSLNNKVKNRIQNKVPVVFNRYNRSYFFNEKLQIRITIDNDLRFKSLLSSSETLEDNLVIEIKYDNKNNFINFLNFNLQLSKYSKFMSGLEIDFEK